MFTPAKRKSNSTSRKSKPVIDSPTTPFSDNRSSLLPGRPATGTPAPWAPRLSVLARISPGNKSEKGDEEDPIKPVFVGELPQVVRDEQVSLFQRRVPGDLCVCGGLDKETSLSWIVSGRRLYLWNYLCSTAEKGCTVLEIPADVAATRNLSRNVYPSIDWLVSVVNWNQRHLRTNKGLKHGISVGIVMCNKKTQAIVYWPDVLSEEANAPVTDFSSCHDSDVSSSTNQGKSSPNWQRKPAGPGVKLTGSVHFNSMIVSAIPGTPNVCVALACSPTGELWQFYCTPDGIQRSKVHQIHQLNENRGYPRSLVWRLPNSFPEKSVRQFFLLTDCEILCFSISLSSDLNVLKLWSNKIVGPDGDLGIKKDLASQKQIWPLDLQVDDSGKVITTLVAAFCNDRVSNSSYTQYSVLTMQYKSGANSSSVSTEPICGRVLEKKAPLQVIIPKARVEDEDFLFSMKLRVGGRPLGSIIILSGDGTATVSHFHGKSTRLYQFDLPYDAGKVLDASIMPPTGDGEDGTWVVLTEKAGIWAIPEKAVILGGVKPPERSLSRKGSSNERSAEDEARKNTFSGSIAAGREIFEASESKDRSGGITTGLARRTAKDEESEALLGQLFHDFLLSGQVGNSLDKLKNSGAFEREGEINVFARFSKSIVDTLAKHWTTTRGADIVAMAVVSTQLMEKHQKHENFLQYLAFSKCHDELCSSQRYSMQIIMEHGEKLGAMIQLREIQSTISQNRSTGVTSSYSDSAGELSGALWDLIQLVGERTRRNTVLLMDRDNAEVFYSKVSELEELFYCLDRQLNFVISLEQPVAIQVQRACEISNACITIVHTATQYKKERHMWYPPPEGLTPWYCQPVVRAGLWSIASVMLQQLNEFSGLNQSAKSDLCAHLEELAEILLEAYAGAITAKIEREEEHKGLLEEYWHRRDVLLDALYKEVKHLAGYEDQDIDPAAEEPNEVLRELSSRLLAISQRHESYGTLWKICCDLNDSVLLRNLMQQSVGPRSGFCYFVFKQLYAKKEFAKLLRLGEEFREELSMFLNDHKDLMWLHEVFLHQFSSASECLHALALSQERTPVKIDEEPETDHAELELTLADRKRFLNLSKISAIAAGKDIDSQRNVKRVEADLKILNLQEEIMKLLPANILNQFFEHQLLHPEDLIKLCLKGKNRELSLWAFEVFAWTSSVFLKCHRSLLEECWRNAADQDEWQELYQAYVTEGWSDEETLQHLRDTLLFQAASRCYGLEADTFEGGFEEVLPLTEENAEMSEVKGLNSSVEAILRQHKDFSYAGKLMRTAIMLPSLQQMATEEGPMPME